MVALLLASDVVKNLAQNVRAGGRRSKTKAEEITINTLVQVTQSLRALSVHDLTKLHP
jgi:hypothetical protein